MCIFGLRKILKLAPKVMTTREIVAKNVKMLRRRIGYKEEFLISQLSIEPSLLALYEKGEVKIPLDHLEKFAYLFGIDAYDLFDANLAANKAEPSLAFRSNSELPDEDLLAIADFKQVVLTYQKIKKGLADE